MGWKKSQRDHVGGLNALEKCFVLCILQNDNDAEVVYVHAKGFTDYSTHYYVSINTSVPIKPDMF